VVDEADAADRRRRQDRAAVGLVVEADIAGHDGEVERTACLADPTHATNKLAHRFRPLGTAEIEVVGDCKRTCADCDEVAPGFRNRLLTALERIRIAIAGRYIAGEREPARPVL